MRIGQVDVGRQVAASHLTGNKQYPRQYDNPIIYDTPQKQMRLTWLV